MTATLTALRTAAPKITPARFLKYHPGCFVQYFDDTPAKDPAKALSSDRFVLAVARRKQLTRCSVCYSLQAFQGQRTKDGLLCFRNMGVDVDLVPPAGAEKTPAEYEILKELFLVDVLKSFPLRPHWLTETAHGFHLVFRVAPAREAESINRAEKLNLRLVLALGGDENAASLTQVFRVPGTLQFKDPAHPFLCRLLADDSASISPYPLARIEDVLSAWEVMRAPKENANKPVFVPAPRLWQDGLGGVGEGHRNAVAASLAGSIVGKLPEELWDTAGWGGLKEWNARNPEPLPERELRAVFMSITRRERAKPRSGLPETRIELHVRVNGVEVWPPAGVTGTSHQKHERPSSTVAPFRSRPLSC